MSYAVRAKDLLNTTRMQDLVFGYYAWTEDGYGLAKAGEEDFEEGQVKHAGSGVLVARGLGLTARHVGQSFQNLDSQFDAITRRKTLLDPQYQTTKVKTEFATMVYQMPTYKGELVQWK